MVAEAVDFKHEVKKAEAGLAACKTAADICNVWKAHYLTLGHRVLGKLLLGRSGDDIIAARGK